MPASGSLLQCMSRGACVRRIARFGACSAVVGPEARVIARVSKPTTHLPSPTVLSVASIKRAARAHLLRRGMWYSRGRNSRGICLTFRRRHRYCSHYAIARRRNVHFKQRAEDVSVSLHFLGAAEVIGAEEVWSDGTCWKRFCKWPPRKDTTRSWH